MTPTHDAYLDNGTSTGLTVDIHIVAYAEIFVNIREKLYRKFKDGFQDFLFFQMTESFRIISGQQMRIIQI